jgi:hypothetical protein
VALGGGEEDAVVAGHRRRSLQLGGGWKGGEAPMDLKEKAYGVELTSDREKRRPFSRKPTRRRVAGGEVWKESSGRLAQLCSYAGTGWSDGEACVRPAASCQSWREKREREEDPARVRGRKEEEGWGPARSRHVEEESVGGGLAGGKACGRRRRWPVERLSCEAGERGGARGPRVRAWVGRERGELGRA